VKFDVGDLYEKSVKKIQIWLELDENISHFTWNLCGYRGCRRHWIAI